MKILRRVCIRDCFDNATSIYYEAGQGYEFEEGDEMAESKHFYDPQKEAAKPVEEKEIRLDSKHLRKSMKYLVKKHPVEAKKVDLRRRDAKRNLIIEIMKKEGTIEDHDEGKTMSEHQIAEREAKSGKPA